jgi:uncharacterized membrane protein
MDAFHTLANTFVEGLEIGFQILSAITILLGFASGLRVAPRGIRVLQLEFARYLLLALEFLLAADILATLRAPDWPEIARLAAVAGIRTGLDWYLSRSLQAEETPRRSET